MVQNQFKTILQFNSFSISHLVIRQVFNNKYIVLSDRTKPCIISSYFNNKYIVSSDRFKELAHVSNTIVITANWVEIPSLISHEISHIQPLDIRANSLKLQRILFQFLLKNKHEQLQQSNQCTLCNLHGKLTMNVIVTTRVMGGSIKLCYWTMRVGMRW